VWAVSDVGDCPLPNRVASAHNKRVSAILYPIAADAQGALDAPAGRAAREREARRLAGGAVVFVREFAGPVYRTEAEARAAHGARLDDPGGRGAVMPEDRFCELKAIAQRSLIPFAAPHTAWRLSVAYWRVGQAAVAAPEPVAPQARKVRRQKGAAPPDPETLDAIARQPLRPIRAQKALDIGLFEFRPPDAPHIVMPDE
jgi:hypothetical protein